MLAPALLAALVSLLLTTPTFGQQMPTPGAWQAGPGAAGDNTYLGLIDAPNEWVDGLADGVALSVSGWFVDTTAQGWAGADDVQVFLGTMDSGKTLGHGTCRLEPPRYGLVAGQPVLVERWVADRNRSPGSLPAGQDTLNVYAHTPSKGWWRYRSWWQSD